MRTKTRLEPLTNILHFHLLTVMLPQIQLQCPSKQLQEHLKADLANGRVIAALAKLITDKRICRVE